MKVPRKISLHVPAGVDTGSRMRLAGKGEGGSRGGPPGDLFVVLHVREHELFSRDGLDVHCEIPIPFHIAALGGEILVPTLRGDVPLKIPAGTQPGKKFRIRGQGIEKQGQKGDQIVAVNVKIPEKLTSEQERARKRERPWPGTPCRSPAPTARRQ